jgi:hypothetical protein
MGNVFSGYGRDNYGTQVLELATGSIARVWRSLDVDQHGDVEPAVKGQRDNNHEYVCRDGRSGEVSRRGDHEDQPPPETMVRRV